MLYFIAIQCDTINIKEVKTMARKSKEEYAMHTENAKGRQEEMKSITTLTEDQHDALAKVCSIRHELHTNQKSIYRSESSKFSELINYMDGEIKNILLSVGLKNDLKWNVIDLPCDYDCEDAEQGLSDVYDFVAKVNKQIENYLRNIDAVHGTSYCPTGALRKF